MCWCILVLTLHLFSNQSFFVHVTLAANKVIIFDGKAVMEISNLTLIQLFFKLTIVVLLFHPFLVNWNPSYDEQAQDRAYRIGTTYFVFYITFILI